MSDQQALLFANAAFYAAFAARDLNAMAAIWSTQAPISCIHPGWVAVVGREAVMASWQAILGNPAAPRITCHNATARSFEALGYVLCYEVLQGGILVATNIFVRELKTWKMLHHHAGHSQTPAHLDEEVHALQ